ncbi:MAG: hypothetical protein HC905_13310 [Bacteroidales bacterium]|nr:hypothetical protein [Bacteroidales bacterium]
MKRILLQIVLFLIAVVLILPGCSKESKNDSEILTKFDMDTLFFNLL